MSVAAAEQVGSAYIGLRPSMQGFHKEVEKDLQGLEPQIVRIGEQLGDSFSSAFGHGLGDLLQPFDDTIRKHKPQAPRQGDQLAGAFASGFQKRLKAAFASLPKAKIDADSTPAQREIQALRVRMQALSGQTVGVDISDERAKAELDDLRTRLTRLGSSSPSIQVRTDVATALGELAAVDAAASRLDGRNVSINAHADTGSAMAALQALGIEMAVISAIPVGASIGAGLGALAAGAGAAGAGIAGLVAVAVPGISHIHEALQAQETAQNQVTTATGRGAAATQSAAVADDQARLRALQLAGAQQQVAQAVQQAAQQHAQALQQVRQAEQSLSQAQAAARQAQEALNAARAQARRDAQDLANNVKDAALGERQAVLDVADARDALAKAKADPSTTPRELARAQLAYDQAVQNLTEQRLQYKRLAADKQKADRTGIAGDQNVVAARRQVASADQSVSRQEQELARARANVASVDRQADAQIASAQRALATQRLSAKLAADQQADAERKAAAAAGGGSAATLKAANAMAKLSPAERQVAKDWLAFKGTYEDWAKALEPAVFPVISGGLKLISGQLPRLNGLIVGSAGAMRILEADAQRALNGPFYTSFLHNVGQAAPTAIVNLGRTGGNVFTGLVGVVNAFLPYTDRITGSVENASEAFATWGEHLYGSHGFVEFMTYAEQVTPVVVGAIGDLWHTGEQLVVALAPMGPTVLTIVGGFSRLVGELAELDPSMVQLIALLYGVSKANKVLGITAVVRGFRGVASATEIAGGGAVGLGARLRSLGSNLQGVTGDAATTKQSLIGLAKTGGIIAAVGATVNIFGDLYSQMHGVDASTGELSRDLVTLGRDHKVSGALAEQWGQDLVHSSAAAGTASGSLVENIRRLAAPSLAQQISSSLLSPFRALGLATDYNEQNIKSLDAALAQMVTSGQTQQAAAAFQQLENAAKAGKLPIRDLRKEFPQYYAAAQAARDGSNNAAGGFNTAGGQAQLAAGQVDRLTGALGSFYNSVRGDVTSANLQFAQQLKSLHDSLARNGDAFHGNSLKALENQDAVNQLARTASDYIDKVYQQVKASKGEQAGQEAAIKAYKSKRTAMINELVQSGLNRKAAKALVDQYLKVPSKRATQFTTPGLTTAKKNVQSLGTAIAKIHGKTVAVNANVKGARTQIGAFYKWFSALDFKKTATIGFKQLGPGRQGVPLGAKANGGITRFASGSERHIAQIARPGEMRLWAEPETQGEAYIPLAKSKRPRSMAILQAVAADFGYQLIPLLNGAIRAFASGGTTKKRTAATGSTPAALPSTSAGSAKGVAGLADAAVTADDATRSLADALPLFAKQAKTATPAANANAAGLRAIGTATATDTTRLRTLTTLQAGPAAKAVTGLTTRTAAATTGTTRNSGAVATSITRHRTLTTATDGTNRSVATSTSRLGANTTALGRQNSTLSTSATRIRRVGTEAVTATGHVNKFVSAYTKKPYSIERHITVDARGKFTMSDFKGFATGGYVRGPGGPTADKIPALLSDTEYVNKASTVRREGVGAFDALNSGQATIVPRQYADGGLVTRKIGTESVPKFTPDYNRMMDKIVMSAIKSTASASATFMKSLFSSGSAALALKLAETREGIKYVYGGTSWNSGMDCSGLTMLSYRKAGVSIPRTSEAQWGAVQHIPVSKALPGDLLFTEFRADGPGHVGFRTQFPRNSAKASFNEPHTGSWAQYRGIGAWTAAGRVPGSHAGGTAGGRHASPARAKAYARAQLPEMGWSQSQFPYLDKLWTRESNWRWNAANPSGAYGVPQAKPGSKMASAGADWRDNAFTQEQWGFPYIKNRYGSPAGAWAHSQRTGWYDNGGEVPPGITHVINASNKPEALLSNRQWEVAQKAIFDAVKGGDGATSDMHLHFDGMTRAAYEVQVRSAVQAGAVAQRRRLRTGRPRGGA